MQLQSIWLRVGKRDGAVGGQSMHVPSGVAVPYPRLASRLNAPLHVVAFENSAHVGPVPTAGSWHVQLPSEVTVPLLLHVTTSENSQDGPACPGLQTHLVLVESRAPDIEPEQSIAVVVVVVVFVVVVVMVTVVDVVVKVVVETVVVVAVVMLVDVVVVDAVIVVDVIVVDVSVVVVVVVEVVVKVQRPSMRWYPRSSSPVHRMQTSPSLPAIPT